MKQKLSFAFASLKSWFAREDGYTTVEFVTIMPLAAAIFFASMESGIITLRKTFLDRALELTVRELRLGLIANPTVAELKTRICNRMVMVDNCAGNLTLELNVRAISSAALSVPSLTSMCINRTTNIEPVLTFQAGAANDLVLVRACLVQDIVFPTSAAQVSIGDPSNTDRQLISTTIYVNEPR